jgi:hypothetical protein
MLSNFTPVELATIHETLKANGLPKLAAKLAEYAAQAPTGHFKAFNRLIEVEAA